MKKTDSAGKADLTSYFLYSKTSPQKEATADPYLEYSQALRS
jgi:hypothetical protein